MRLKDRLGNKMQGEYIKMLYNTLDGNEDLFCYIKEENAEEVFDFLNKRIIIIPRIGIEETEDEQVVIPSDFYPSALNI